MTVQFNTSLQSNSSSAQVGETHPPIVHRPLDHVVNLTQLLQTRQLNPERVSQIQEEDPEEELQVMELLEDSEVDPEQVLKSKIDEAIRISSPSSLHTRELIRYLSSFPDLVGLALDRLHRKKAWPLLREILALTKLEDRAFDRYRWQTALRFNNPQLLELLLSRGEFTQQKLRKAFLYTVRHDYPACSKLLLAKMDPQHRAQLLTNQIRKAARNSDRIYRLNYLLKLSDTPNSPLIKYRVLGAVGDNEWGNLAKFVRNENLSETTRQDAFLWAVEKDFTACSSFLLIRGELTAETINKALITAAQLGNLDSLRMIAQDSPVTLEAAQTALEQAGSELRPTPHLTGLVDSSREFLSDLIVRLPNRRAALPLRRSSLSSSSSSSRSPSARHSLVSRRRTSTTLQPINEFLTNSERRQNFATASSSSLARSKYTSLRSRRYRAPQSSAPTPPLSEPGRQLPVTSSATSSSSSSSSFLSRSPLRIPKPPTTTPPPRQTSVPPSSVNAVSRHFRFHSQRNTSSAPTGSAAFEISRKSGSSDFYESKTK